MNDKDKISFVIPLPPITKKNSQRIGRRKIGNKTVPFIMPSKKYKDYEKACAPFLVPLSIDYGVNIKAVFYMPTNRKVDLVNLEEALHDILVKYGVLADDNSNIIISCDGSRVRHSKNNPRTEVTITGYKQYNGNNENIDTD